jgi:hypothetical protein
MLLTVVNFARLHYNVMFGRIHFSENSEVQDICCT